MKTKEQKLLESAKRIALTAPTWADLSNALFGHADGIVAKAYPTRKEREKFVRSPEYKAIQQMIGAAQERTGLIEGATPKRSGKFVVRLPRSLHSALVTEAMAEGVSLNQLVVAKLAIPLSDMSPALERKPLSPGTAAIVAALRQVFVQGAVPAMQHIKE